MTDPLTVSVAEAAELLGVSRGLAYTLVHTGQLPAVRLGSKRIGVPRAALEAMLRDPEVLANLPNETRRGRQ